MGGSRDTMANELEVLEKYAKLCIEIASARCWSQSQYTMCLPNVFAIVHHVDPDQRTIGLQFIKKLWDAVLKAEDALQDTRIDAAVRETLQQVMRDLGWNRGQVAREIYLICREGGWNAADSEIRQLGFLLFSPPANTKFFLEDCFAHLADVINRIARNMKLSKHPIENFSSILCFLVIVFCFVIFIGWNYNAMWL